MDWGWGPVRSVGGLTCPFGEARKKERRAWADVGRTQADTILEEAPTHAVPKGALYPKLVTCLVLSP